MADLQQPASPTPRTPRLTFVKKILEDGSPCAKCGDVEQRLRDGGHWHRLDRVVIADVRDPQSEGVRLAEQHGVERAPFFLVEDQQGTRVYTVFLQFQRDVLGQGGGDPAAESRAILDAHPDLDLL